MSEILFGDYNIADTYQTVQEFTDAWGSGPIDIDLDQIPDYVSPSIAPEPEELIHETSRRLSVSPYVRESYQWSQPSDQLVNEADVWYAPVRDLYQDTIKPMANRAGVAWDYIVGDHTPAPASRPFRRPSPGQDPDTLGALRAISVSGAGFAPGRVKAFAGLHLLADTIAGYTDLRREGRQAGQGYFGLIEPYLAMGTLALSSYTMEVMEHLHSEGVRKIKERDNA